MNTDELNECEAKIERYIRAAREPVTMPELIANYEGVHADDMVRAAVWFLLDRRRLRFTNDRELVPA